VPTGRGVCCRPCFGGIGGRRGPGRVRTGALAARPALSLPLRAVTLLAVALASVGGLRSAGRRPGK
ncbi:MAG: hypothetical protein M3350_07165, partial [Actinomycetota bacterium]|nr:hypothetical protein [Actinomycetota bacterium]